MRPRTFFGNPHSMKSRITLITLDDTGKGQPIAEYALTRGHSVTGRGDVSGEGPRS